VRGLTADKGEDYELIWENLARRSGHIDEPERAKRRFDNKKQLESETIEDFEQCLRTEKMILCSNYALLVVG